MIMTISLLSVTTYKRPYQKNITSNWRPAGYNLTDSESRAWYDNHLINIVAEVRHALTWFYTTIGLKALLTLAQAVPSSENPHF